MPEINNSNQKKNNTKHKKSRTKHYIKITLQLMTICILLSITGGIFYFYHAYGKIILQLQAEAKQKVSASTEDTFRSVQTSLVYDAQGNLISTLKAEKDVYYIKYNEIPTAVVDAMVVTEDRKFMEHKGVDYLANVRAAVALIKHKGKITQGASTITQQLARNVFLTHKVTYERKMEEIFIAQEMEKKYSKLDIMEYYLNEIYFANGHYGIQAAAQGYFGEGVNALSLSQLAFLCAIPNNPNLYNPVSKFENTLKRRDRVLEQMYDAGKISFSDYADAISEKITLAEDKADRKNYVETYVYYSAIRALMKNQGFELRYQFDSEEEEQAYDEAYDELYSSCQKDLYVKGYRIYTSIDLEKQELLQTCVDDSLKDFTEVNKEGVYQMQGAAVSIDNDTGKVVAIVGGRDQDLGGYTLNRAYQSFRQPGSSIKPLIVYTPSFERNYRPASIVVDEYLEGGPKNASKSYAGKIRLQKAIEASLNTIAWKLFEELTPAVGLSYLLDMNFAKITEKDYVPAAALGGLTIGVSPVEMAAGYATLENNGYYREPTCIVKITDADGDEIVGENSETTQIYQTNAAKIMTEALTGVITKGTGKGLGLTNTISAGKTGTTNDKKDGWFVGYTPYYTTSVWVGYDMPKTVNNLKGATYPGTIWHNYMEQIHTTSMNEKFEYYDWRAVLKAAKEEAKRKKAEEQALLTQAAQQALEEDQTVEQDNQEDLVPDQDNETDLDTQDTVDDTISEAGDTSTEGDDTGDASTEEEDVIANEEDVVSDEDGTDLNTEEDEVPTEDNLDPTIAGDTTSGDTTSGDNTSSDNTTTGQTTDDSQKGDTSGIDDTTQELPEN